MKTIVLSDLLQGKDKGDCIYKKEFKLPRPLQKSLSISFLKRMSFHEIWIGACLIYLYRITRIKEFNVQYSHLVQKNTEKFSSKNDNVINNIKPLNLSINDEQEARQVFKAIEKKLKGCSEEVSTQSQPLSVSILLSKEELRFGHPEECQFSISVSCSKPEYFFSLKSTLENKEAAEGALNRINGHITTLLADIIRNPSHLIHTLPLLTKEEYQKIIVDWNDTKTDYPKDKTVSQLFEEIVEQTPFNIAATFKEHSLSYKELNEKSNQLAHLLREKGVRPNSLVAICIERSLNWLIAILGILKAGGTYTPIDSSFPKERIEFILEDTDSTVFITTEKLAKRFLTGRKLIVKIDSDWGKIATQPIINLKNLTSINDPAYAIYTSGSTGNPKGIQISIKSLLNLLFWHKNTYSVTKNDQASVLAGEGFDASVWEIWPYLISGATLHVAERETIVDCKKLINWLYDKKIKIVFLPTPLAEVFLKSPENKKLNCLQFVLIGGEMLKIFPPEGRSFKSFNHYGPTENTVVTTQTEIPTALDGESNERNIPSIGKPISNTRVYILDPFKQPVPVGIIGELYIESEGLTKGYINQPSLTAQKFISNPFSDNRESKIYKTGDLVYWRSNGDIEYIGRKDDQIKIFGFRIELSEIESSIIKYPGINQAFVFAKENKIFGKILVAYLKFNAEKTFNFGKFYDFLKKKLPQYLIPSKFIEVMNVPFTPNGKVDRKKILSLCGNNLLESLDYLKPSSQTEEMIAKIWSKLLNIDNIGVTHNFFDLGGNSLLLNQQCNLLNNALNTRGKIKVVDILTYPTIQSLSRYIVDRLEKVENRVDYEGSLLDVGRSSRSFDNIRKGLSSTDIAIIGLSGRFPGAKDIPGFWNNLKSAAESIKTFSEEELKGSGVSDELLGDSSYVKRGGIIADIEKFDAKFFGYSVLDAKTTDPQQRLFLECAWEALESAGYAPTKYSGLIGVYASMADSLYLQNNLLKNQDFLQSFDWFQARMATSITTLSTQVSYRLNLTGPSFNITVACSSSLVAIATACKELLEHNCDLALAGAAAITVPQISGYLHQEGGINSPDGHCRAFDEQGRGTVFTSGVGVVVLKRLDEAMQDGDSIYAVIKGCGVNNDGADKLGYTAPSVHGQAACVASALDCADITADSISYVEAHGTGTELGDPIEIAALSKAFCAQTEKNQYCAIGSVKTNIGHTDIAAGMAGFIKTALALKYQLIPASLHFQEPNSKIDFENSPFYVNTELKEWVPARGFPRRAGVNASGIGGTNAFVVLEECKESEQKENRLSRSHQLLLWSAKTKTALEKMTQNLFNHLDSLDDDRLKHPDYLADTAFTLQVGRSDFEYRRMLVCQDAKEATLKLEGSDASCMLTRQYRENQHPKIVFMFSGQGSQYIGMGNTLYYSEPQFAKEVEACLTHLSAEMQACLRSLLFAPKDSLVQDVDLLTSTRILQPALFVLEYALAKLLIYWGIKPDAVIGHSIGEYVAACLADVMSVQEALHLVCIRGELMSHASEGAMIAVLMSEEETQELLNDELSLAAVNAPQSCVVSGSSDAVDQLEKRLKEQEITYRRLKTSHAFHSHLMDVVLDDFKVEVSRISFSFPTIPFISNVTGRWIDRNEIIPPNYWVNHLRQTVKFKEGLEALLESEHNIFLELGPGKALVNFSRETSGIKNGTVSSIDVLPASKEKGHDQSFLLSAVGQLWLTGVSIRWDRFYEEEKRHRIPLPTYPFERQTYWINPDQEELLRISNKKLPYQKWFYEPSWEKQPLPLKEALLKEDFTVSYGWIIFLDDCGVGQIIYEQLKRCNQWVLTVQPSKQFTVIGDNQYSLNLHSKEDYLSLLKMISEENNLPWRILHFCSLTEEHHVNELDLEEIEQTTYLSFYSVLFFVQAYIELQLNRDLALVSVGNEIFSVKGDENIYPAKATITGPCRVIPQEHPNIRVQVLDVLLDEMRQADQGIRLCNQIILDCMQEKHDVRTNIFAYRGSFRWVQTFKSIQLLSSPSSARLKTGGTYFFTGGLGGISLTIAQHIAETVDNPHLILLSRSSFPQDIYWKKILEDPSSEDGLVKKIRFLMNVKTLGAKITILQGDVADLNRMQDIITEIKTNNTSINGVIHAAGIAGGGLVQLKTPDVANKVLAPKVIGTTILTHLLRNESLDFFILCSSVSSVLGELSQVDYCSANACLDAFVHAQEFKNIDLFSSINWTTWREVGMAVETERPDDVTFFDRNNDISPAEGAKIFHDVLENHYSQVIVSTFDINLFVDMINKNKEEESANEAISRNEMLGLEGKYIAPTNEIESRLVSIWQTVLGLDKIGITDNFFDLGGHSLMALRLLSKIEKELNAKVGLPAFQDSGTIQKLAEKVRSAIPAKQFSSILIPIRPKGEGPPLFCFHPVGGSIFCYSFLAKHLTFNCPIYGLQDPSIEKGALLYNSLEEMAAHYLKVVQDMQPNGPYFLCGLSFGGTLSVEIAKNLRKKGEEIKLLALFDSWAKLSDYQHDEEKFKKRMLYESRQVDNPEVFTELAWQRMQMLLNYKPSVIEEKVVLFKAKTLLPEYKEIKQEYNHWDYYTKQEIERYLIPGDHETILEEPNITLLAKQLDIILNRN